MRPLFLSAALAATLIVPAAHADMVIIQQGHAPAPLMQVLPQGTGFGMAEAFIRDHVANRMPWGAGHVVPQEGIPHAPPILLDDQEESDPIPFAGAWRLTEIMDDEGQPLAVDAALLAETEFTVDVDGPFSAYVGCNRMFGRIEMRDGVITSAEYGMTLMGCIGPIGDLENAMMRVLDSATLVAMGLDMLVLLDGEGDKLAELVPVNGVL